MSRILIEVEDQIAQAFRNASPEQKKHLSEAANVILKKKLNDLTLNRYKDFLNEASDEAEQNGLTSEILNELLKKDD